MGLYVESKDDKNKLEWTIENGIEVLHPCITPPDVGDDEFLVCAVNNGAFYAIAVAFSDRELDAFTRPEDNRLKSWFVIKKELLKDVCPLWDAYIGGTE